MNREKIAAACRANDEAGFTPNEDVTHIARQRTGQLARFAAMTGVDLMSVEVRAAMEASWQDGFYAGLQLTKDAL